MIRVSELLGGDVGDKYQDLLPKAQTLNLKSPSTLNPT